MTRTESTRQSRIATIAGTVAATAAGLFALFLARSELPQLRRYLRIKQM